MIFSILIPFFIALISAFLKGSFRKLFIWLIPLLPLSLFIWFAISFFGQGSKMFYGLAIESIIPVRLDIHLDGLGALFALLISGIGTLIFWYARAYMKNYPYSLRLMGLLSLFMGAMLGVVLSDNLLVMFVFWELTSISSFFLIGFNSKNKESIQSALQALLVTGTGGLIMLAGLVILGEGAGSYSLSILCESTGNFLSSSTALVAFGLILIGAISKSAQFPFHFWLPGAMKAPTPVSAYLHSATMVKAGVYLLARIFPIFGGEEYWQWSLMSIGGVTMLYAGFHSIYRSDLKSILAYSTVAALGVLVFLIGIGTPESLYAASLFILIHALYKAPLFLVAGIIDLKTKTRNTFELGGLYRVMPIVAIAAVLAALSNAGVPLTFGFIGKDLMYESTIIQRNGMWLTAALLITNVCIMIAGFKAGIKPFAGKLPTAFNETRKPAFPMWMSALILASLGLIFGLLPAIPGSAFIPAMMEGFGFSNWSTIPSIWHGFNLVLGLSALTLILGTAGYLFLRNNKTLELRMATFESISPRHVFSNILNGFDRLAHFINSQLQHGYLRKYIMFILVFVLSLMIYKIRTGFNFMPNLSLLTAITIYEFIIVVILITSIFFTVFSTSRLVAVASLGVVGVSICLIFVFYSAPDLAMTQFTIDTLTVILFVLVLYRLPKFIPITFAKRHVRDALIAISFGSVIGLMAFEVLQYESDKTISHFYAANSYVLAKGKNIVNVILVDFRGADTLIEIVVLCIAALGVYSLLKLHLKQEEKQE
jgi:multicomponent Na+:H+ antiporter subunit A